MPMSKINKIQISNQVDTDLLIKNGQEEEQENPNTGCNTAQSEYDYLLKMNLLSLTEEMVEDVMKTKEKKQIQLDVLLKKTEEELWEHDLDVFLVALEVTMILSQLGNRKS